MQQTYRCPTCHQQVTYGMRFCGNCGIPLNWQQQTPSPPVYQEPTNYEQRQGKFTDAEILLRNSRPHPNETDRWRLCVNVFG